MLKVINNDDIQLKIEYKIISKSVFNNDKFH